MRVCVFVRASACLIRFVYNNSNQHKLCFCQCLHKVSAQLRVCVSVYTLALFVVPPPPFLFLILLFPLSATYKHINKIRS